MSNHISAAAPEQTKIIATLGPCSATPDMLARLVAEGADIFRLNFSHGTHEDHRNAVALIRALERESGKQIGILADLQGPKLRIGTFADGPVALHQGMRIRFDLDTTPGDGTRVCFPHPDVLAALEKGARFLMDDGNVGMIITGKGDGYVDAEVQHGHTLSDRKGVNVPDLSGRVETLTAKDLRDLELALELGVDWIAQSFVQTAEDVVAAKDIIAGRARLIAKIEKPAAVDNIHAILAEADAIMIARGDLGVEIPFEKVPAVQKKLLQAAQDAGKPAVVATQMLESMRTSPRPTRAEVTDVAQAVLDGANGVMLSGETSAGRYPVEAVSAMRKICTEMETGNTFSLALASSMKQAAPLAEDFSAAAEKPIPVLEKLKSILRPRRPVVCA